MKKVLLLGLFLVVVLSIALAIDIRIRWPLVADASPASRPASAEAPTQLWTCGMHSQVVQDHPGNCPICHMRLTPMRTARSDGSGSRGEPPAVVIDPSAVQNMGVRTAEVTRGPLVRFVRTVGYLEAPETGFHDISPKVGGWIEHLYANQEGMHVEQGEPLFDLYSPDLVIAQEELIAAVRSLHALRPAGDAALRQSADSLVASAKRKLRLLDVSDDDIASVVDTLVASRTLPFRSPASGTVVEKAVVQGSSTQAGQKLMRIEDHGTLWLQMQIFERQLPSVAIGDEVQATLDSAPGRTFVGRVTFIHPHVDPTSRTVMARAELANGAHVLRPGEYASAVIFTPALGDAVQVPREAVIDSGTRQIAFVAKGDGHFEPRVVNTGTAGEDGRVEILDGLSPGELVVTSGQFLLDAESRTTEAIEKLRASSQADTMTMHSSPAPATGTAIGGRQ